MDFMDYIAAVPRLSGERFFMIMEFMDSMDFMDYMAAVPWLSGKGFFMIMEFMKFMDTNLWITWQRFTGSLVKGFFMIMEFMDTNL